MATQKHTIKSASFQGFLVMAVPIVLGWLGVELGAEQTNELITGIMTVVGGLWLLYGIFRRKDIWVVEPNSRKGTPAGHLPSLLLFSLLVGMMTGCQTAEVPTDQLVDNDTKAKTETKSRADEINVFAIQVNNYDQGSARSGRELPGEIMEGAKALYAAGFEVEDVDGDGQPDELGDFVKTDENTGEETRITRESVDEYERQRADGTLARLIMGNENKQWVDLSGSSGATSSTSATTSSDQSGEATSTKTTSMEQGVTFLLRLVAALQGSKIEDSSSNNLPQPTTPPAE